MKSLKIKLKKTLKNSSQHLDNTYISAVREVSRQNANPFAFNIPSSILALCYYFNLRKRKTPEITIIPLPTQDMVS